MLLFEGEFGNILHTGDCRLTVDCIQNLPMQYASTRGRKPQICLDYLFLDCTFSGHAMKFPSKDSAVQQVHFPAFSTMLAYERYSSRIHVHSE